MRGREGDFSILGSMICRDHFLEAAWKGGWASEDLGSCPSFAAYWMCDLWWVICLFWDLVSTSVKLGD